ncbi:sigma 54-interacting transcriptional regulator [bacterium]|nr:sigma 54-interacting transcriptional regulator [bacterium]
MKILLTFIGNNDCEGKGPILSILEKLSFDRLYLFYNSEKYLKPASQIRDYCQKNFPKMQVFYQEVASQNPTDYNTVYPALYEAVSKVKNENPDAKFTVSLTSGTPTMHSCWIFLKQGKTIDAKLIQVSRENGVSEVNFSLDDFPKIKSVERQKVELTRLQRENKTLKQKLPLVYDFPGESPEIIEVKDKIKRFADSELSVLIHGESGTGKELVAEALHYNSRRKEKPFLPVNCSAIPENLFESEFFGHKKGAFTGATADKDGFFRLAHQGTLFLDEIADLSLTNQAKLLRVLDGKNFSPLGATKTEKADVRILSATHKNLKEAVKNGDFREDLFYRIKGTEIVLPPLRKRGNDKILIAEKILAELNKKYETNKVFEKTALEKILSLAWKGNIRELKNVVENAFWLSENSLRAEDLKANDFLNPEGEIVLPVLLDEVLKNYYKAALKQTGENAEKAAQLLGLKPHTFRARLKNLNLK